MAKQRKTVRPQMREYKGGECAHCGKTVKEIAEQFLVVNRYFHFHHVTDDKAENYDNLVRRANLSTEILDEIDKCVLLCTACHDILHDQAITSHHRYFIRLNDKGRTRVFWQKLNGQAIYDAKAQTMTIFNNKTPTIFPCRIAFKLKDDPKHGERRLATFRAIERRFIRIMETMKVGDEFGIWSFAGKLIAHMEKIADTKYKMTQLVAFPVTKIELDDDDGNVEFFIRNGYMLSRNGDVHIEGRISGVITYEKPPQG